MPAQAGTEKQAAVLMSLLSENCQDLRIFRILCSVTPAFKRKASPPLLGKAIVVRPVLPEMTSLIWEQRKWSHTTSTWAAENDADNCHPSSSSTARNTVIPSTSATAQGKVTCVIGCCLSYLFFSLLETECPPYGAQAGLEFEIFLPQPPECCITVPGSVEIIFEQN
jgi:hypothetical protein